MTKTDKHDIADVVLVTLLSVIFSVIGVAIFAAVVGFAEVPENVEAQLILPGEEPVALSAGKHTFVRERQEETQE